MTTSTLPESLKPYESLTEMRVRYNNLVREFGNTLGDPPAALLNTAEKFVSRGCATGTLLDDPDERWDGQNMLNFWAKILYRYSGVPVDERPMAVLAQFSSLEAAPAKVGDAPFQAPPLPPDVYVARESFLSDLKQQLLAGRNIALCSSPGMGKTLIATNLAHDPEVREKYPDGVLWAKLGDHPDVSSILRAWGEALKISNEVDSYIDRERAQKLIRQRLARRQMLLVMDDAWQSDAVTALMLGGTNCVHIITTYLMSVALDFDPQAAVTVSGLSESDGLALLVRRAPRAVEGKEDEARKLVERLAGSPLGLSLIANYFASQDSGRYSPDLKELFGRLVEEKQAIEAKPLYQDPRDEVQTASSLLAAISWCFEHLSDKERHVLEAFSSFPPKPNSFSHAAARYIAVENPGAIDMLLDKGLLERAAPDRYSLHRSVSDFLKRRSHTGIDDTSWRRMAIFFVNFAKDTKTESHEFEQEEKNIFAALETAYEHGMWELVVEGTEAIFGYLDRRGSYVRAKKHLLRAREAAEKLNNDKSLASILLKLGEINERQSEYTEGNEHLKESLDIAQTVEDHDITARALQGLGVVNMALAKYEKAQHYLDGALKLALQTDNTSVACAIETRLGWLERALGRFEASRKRTEHALALAMKNGYTTQIAELNLSLGVLDFFKTNYEDAKAHDEEGLHYAEKAQDKRLQCALHQALGGVEIELENFDAAETHLMRSLQLAVEIGHRWYTSVIWKELGELKLKQKYPNSASDAFKKALELAREVNSSELMGLSIYGLARVAAAQKNYAEARLQGQTCLNIFQLMGYYKKDEVQKWIDSLPVGSTATGSTLQLSDSNMLPAC
jgi:tetratricopeptide (TPR) repeat protein